MRSYYVVIFRSRLKPGHEDEYMPLAKRMAELVKTIPGYVRHRSYESADGERVTISEFKTEEALKKWHTHPEHIEARRLGRGKFYSEYSVEVAKVERNYSSIIQAA